MTDLVVIRRVTGRPIPLGGNDIDTDRIIPARYMKAVTFDGLGQYAFYDVRFDADGRPVGHVMDDPRFRAKGERVAVVNKNFGCGSSREHAPQALLRWGIKGIIGESFAGIFFGNCVAIGIPCVTASEDDVARLMASIEENPADDIELDVAALRATYRGNTYDISLPAGARKQLLDGTWNATRVLLSVPDAVRKTADRLPYMRGFE